MQRVIRIGTRESQLALWQAKKVQHLLSEIGYKSELVLIKSQGDLNTISPLHELGTTGIFTKALDDALYAKTIDIAVHSCKDLPTNAPKDIDYAAYLERGPYQDVLVHKGDIDFLNDTKSNGHIATGSIRRHSQWIHKFPNHQVSNLRGNVQTRLQKLKDHDWHGAIFAKAGLERLELTDNLEIVDLDWMIPAPAQGVVAICCLEEDQFSKEIVAMINVKDSEISSTVERRFLNTLEGGCSAPIGALAKIMDQLIHFKGVLFSLDGQRQYEIEAHYPISDYKICGQKAAQAILDQGGKEIINELRHQK